MGIRTSYRHNKDGSVTKRTTYSRKTIFGNRVSESYSETYSAQDIAAANAHKREKRKARNKKLLIAFAVIMVLGGIVTIFQPKVPAYHAGYAWEYARDGVQGMAYQTALEGKCTDEELLALFKHVIDGDGYKKHTMFFWSSEQIMKDGFEYDVAQINDDSGSAVLIRK